MDTANVKEIQEAASLGVLDGVTTNPSLVAKEDRSFCEALVEICSIVVVENEDGGSKRALLRQLKETGWQTILRPLNRRYEDLPVTKQQRIWAEVYGCGRIFEERG